MIMYVYISPAIFSFLGLLTSVLLKSSIAQNDLTVYLQHNCTPNPQFTQGSLYQSNLYKLLFNLTSTSDTHSFNNLTIGKNSNRVYGLYLCRVNVENQLCGNCIQTAANDILQKCKSSKEAIIWYSLCMIRYSNRNIFSIKDVSIHIADSIGPAKYSQFDELLAKGFVNLFDWISSERSSATTFTVLEGNIFMNLDVDCTPDLSLTDCRSCLETGLPRLQTRGREFGFVFLPSCRLQYNFLDVSSLFDSAQRFKKLYIGMGIISAFAALLLILIAFLIYRLKKREKMKRPNGLEKNQSMENLQIEYNAIKAATYNFSEANKLGQGGFGIVYMGTLSDGQAIAVKRLSNASGQGIREFKTEACLAAKLQHKNLVKLYGFCLEGDEMLLVYEFVPNKSLDRFLFDVKRGAYLKWQTRYKIIVGIARGLLYLHEDSNPKIIHRDLKPSNILLDGEMNPKIADFGLAKLFGGDQSQGNTSRIGGTFGYMAPEYVSTGNFSVKSDIFSYGVILLEIISGMKNRNSNPNTQQEENLLSYAWRLWEEGSHLNLLDSTIGNQFSEDEVKRCIQVGLLCTQEDPTKRPKMASVLIMLNTQLGTNLPSPDCPPTFPYKHDIPEVSPRNTRITDVITELSPR